MTKLIKIQGFIPYLLVAFINAFVDLGHKIVIQNTLFKSFTGNEQVLLTAIVNGLILLPFVLLFTPSGYLSDRFPKEKVMRISAVFAVIITCLITYSYHIGNFYLAFSLTLILAMQSALYSPAKYGYIRELVGTENLSAGNGWVQAVSMVAILAGSAVFSALFELDLSESTILNPHHILIDVSNLGWILVAGAVVECVLAYRLPHAAKTEKVTSFPWANYRTGKTLLINLRLLFKQKAIWQSVLGLTAFLSISQVMIAAFPAYAKSSLGMDNTFVIQCIIAMAIVGLMLGSGFAAKHSQKHINLALVPLGAAVICLTLFLLPNTSSHMLLASLFLLLGFGGALMMVPLNSLIQFHANEHHIGRILAGNNFVQNIGMLFFLGLTVLFATTELDVRYVLWGMFALSAILLTAVIFILPQTLGRTFMARLIGRKYRLKVVGFENLPEEGIGTLLLGNHISWIDWAIIQMAVPKPVHFVMDRGIYQRWYLKWFFDLYKVIPISPGQSKQALLTVTELLKSGETVCLFPEGRISHLGQLGEFKKGFERACADAEGVIIPFYLRGLWGSSFSRSNKKLNRMRKNGIKRDIVVAFGQSMDIHSDAAQVKQKVFEMSVAGWNEYAETLNVLPKTWIETAKSKPGKWAIADSNGQTLSHMKTLIGCLLIKSQIQHLPGKNMGLLVPTSSAGIMTNIAAMMAGKTVVNINYTSSINAIVAAKENAHIQSIVTSKKFIAKLEQRGVDCTSILQDCQVFYLEDMTAKISIQRKWLTTLAAFCLPASWLYRVFCKVQMIDDTAAILFSSGSEGTPKGVMLSHKNIMANLRQVSDVLNVRDNDKIMATLPLFHAFGLTVTGMLPLMEGIPVICHPDPTDGLNIAKAVTRFEATLMCATSTFLRMYQRNRRIKPMMFNSLRAVVSGAEKLDPTVKETFQQKFLVPVLEGYGTTETTPVASVNLPGHLIREQAYIQEAAKDGTVGLALPGTTFRIVDPVTYESLPAGEDGLILIGGAQIMKGYLNDAEKTDSVITYLDGMRWYKTGDKGHVDEDGYLTIVDRYSRFAKLAGEMVSLGEVEQKAKQLLNDPDFSLMAVNLPDAKKGEQIVLLIDSDVEPEDVKKMLTQNGMPPLMLPSKIFKVDALPVLGSGKADFSGAKQLALELMAA